MNGKNFNSIVNLRHELHKNAEQSHHEVNTQKILKDFIRKNTSFSIVENKKWFYAVLKKDDAAKGIAFRAEIDALPVDETVELPYSSVSKGTAHKCGHDGHSAALAGLALELSKKQTDKNIYLLFQHAEETGEGSSECMNFLSENKIDEMYAFHNIPGYEEGKIILRNGIFACASKGMTISLIGTPTHAAYPEFGKNPAFAAADILSALQDITDQKRYEGMVLCTVISVNIGEKAFGTSASKGEIALTLRAQNERELDQIQAAIVATASAAARKSGLGIAFSYCDEFTETRSNNGCVDKLRELCGIAKTGYIEPEEPFRWSEDYGRFLKKAKGVYFGIGSGKNHPQLHTAEYDFPDAILKPAVDMFTAIAGC